MVSAVLALVSVIAICAALDTNTQDWSFAGGFVGAISSVCL